MNEDHFGVEPPDPPSGYYEPDLYPEVNKLSDLIFTRHGRRIIATESLLILFGLWVVPIDYSMLIELVESLEWVGAAGILVFIFGGPILVYRITLRIHEHIHRIVNEYYGYQVEIQYGILKAIALVENQWIERNHNLRSLLAPLLVISSISYVISLFSTSLMISVVFGLVFFLNTAMSCSDVYGFTNLIRRPKGTLAWHIETKSGLKSFIYEPK